jgi:3-deoxy-D-manno-octulosonic-acid transferase
MYWLYNIIFSLLFILSFPYFFLRGIIGRHGVGQRLGLLSSELKQKLKTVRPVWIHASSVGEVKLIPVLIETLTKKDSGLKFIVTTTTKTGQQEALKILGNQATALFYQPVDLPWITAKVMKLVRPRALLLVETEFWPNLIRSAKKEGAIVGLVNGRISSKSFSRYSLFRPLSRTVLSQLDFFAVQTEKDLHRLNALGAQINKMTKVGSLKFDQKFLSPRLAKKLDRKSLGLTENDKVLVAGSTRPGEEELVLSVYRQLNEKRPLILVLAPRHLDRIGEIELLLQQKNLSYVKKSRLKENRSAKFKVLLLDTMGELAEIYSVADVAFVGGSLVPLGGHNPLEPAVYGVPVLFGPYMEHSQAAAELLIESGLGYKVRDEKEFLQQAREVLSNGLDTARLFADFQKALSEKSGAAQKTAEIFFKNLPPLTD